MARREAIFIHGGQASGGRGDEEELRRLAREVIWPELEPSLRRMVREEMLHVLRGCMNPIPCPALRIPSNQNQAPITGHFQLYFNKELPETIFTENIIESKDHAPLQIFITDADKRKITSGPLSMIRIEILVLDGDFGDEEQGSWTAEEFNKHVLREREGKKLLKGNRFITLKCGVGNICNISFTDNSKWTRTHKFRLGARSMQHDHVNERTQRIQEAVTGAFYVNEHRGEYTMKHHTPLLEDEVWRLKNIGKNGPYHRRLLDHGIITVEDFLKYLVMDQKKLCSILFEKKEVTKKWKTIVQHAWKCDLGHKCYSYIIPGEQIELAFNSVFQVIAVRFGNCMWQPLCQLSAPQQDLVNRLKRVAYDNQNAMVELNDPTHSLSGLPSALLATYAPETNPTDVHHANVQVRDEAVYETDAPAGSLDPSVPIRVEDSNHVEGEQQNCLATEGCNNDGVFDQEAVFAAMESWNTDEVLDWSTGGCGTESCIDQVQPVSRDNAVTHIPRSRWVKVRFSVKQGTPIWKTISARRSANKIGFSGLLSAVRFGRAIRRRAAATRTYHLLDIEQSWSRGLSPPPFIYTVWPLEEDNYF